MMNLEEQEHYYDPDLKLNLTFYIKFNKVS